MEENNVTEQLSKNDDGNIHDTTTSSSFPKGGLEYIINTFRDAICPEMFEESGCAVYEQLGLTKEMIEISIMEKALWYIM